MNKPLTKTERKFLVFKKCQEGLSYGEACKEVTQELSHLDRMSKEKRVKKKMEKNVLCPKCCKPNYISFHELKKHKMIDCKFCGHKFVNSQYAGVEKEDDK